MIRKLILISLIFVISACQPKTTSVDVKDDFESSKIPQRIITLSPHLTELVYSLGAQDRLIATVEYSDYPETAKDIPRIGNAFQIDWERLALLKPDLVIVWDGGNPKQIIEELENKNYSLLKLKNPRLTTVPLQLNQLAARLGIDESKVDQLTNDYMNGLTALIKNYGMKEKINVFYQISASPLYTVDSKHVISDMLITCGANNIFETLENTGAPVSTESVVAADPNVILTGEYSHAEVVENWTKLGFFSEENILQVSSDEVTRASLRMLEGTRDICETLDKWRLSR